MAGYVRSDQKCPVCREMGLPGKFVEELSGRSIILICPQHRTSPHRLYVDQSGFGLKTRKRKVGHANPGTTYKHYVEEEG